MSTDCGGNRLYGFHTPSGDDYLVAISGQPSRRCRSDPGSATGDERYAFLFVHLHGPFIRDPPLFQMTLAVARTYT